MYCTILKLADGLFATFVTMDCEITGSMVNIARGGKLVTHLFTAALSVTTLRSRSLAASVQSRVFAVSRTANRIQDKER